MAFPQTINPASPLGSDSPAQGDDEFRALKSFVAEVLGLPVSPASVAAALGKVDVTGQAPIHARLTNGSGGAMVVGDVVALSAAADNSIGLSDVAGSRIPFVVAREATANGSEGLFAYGGVVTAKAQGAIARGEYVRKSATSKAVETTGVAIGPTQSPPPGTIGVALAAAAGNLVVMWFNPFIVAAGAGIPGADFLEFTGIGTPATPASGNLRLYSPSGTPLRSLAFVDAGGQIQILSRHLFVGNGNPFANIVSTAAETSIFSSAPTIKGNTLGTTRLLRFTIVGDFLNNTGAGDKFIVRVKYGGTTFLTLTPIDFTASATRYGWAAHGEIAAAGATNVQVAYGRNTVPSAAGVAGTSVTIATSPPVSYHTGGAVDSTADQTFDVTVQNDTNSANESTRVFYVGAEVLG